MSELITKDEMQTMLSLARAFNQSGYFKDIKSEAQAFTKIILGREFKMGPAEALRALHLINGKPGFEASWIAGKIKSSGHYKFRILEHTDDSCVIRFFELNAGRWEQLTPDSSFTMDDARKADILSNPNYRKYPRNMLFARALTNGARWHCPDVFNGAVFTPDELRGEHTEILPPVAEILASSPPPAPIPVTEAQIQADLERLGLRKPAAAALDAPIVVPSNPWLHTLEGVVIDGENTLMNAGRHLCELPADWFKKAQSPAAARMLTENDAAAIKAALNAPDLRGEALAELLEQEAGLSLNDDEIPPAYTEPRGE